VQYRAFSNDSVLEICEDKNALLGIESVTTEIQSYPVDGMYVLSSLPGTLERFISGN